ncbi:uncharacterized protein LAESUDRAFT_762303 [Laetiporus sulphureus 93-53]|uniref:Uncharacterized protein n=1 Tax=Laetiporus sulphureus 93-53 TaxID=1314785 RepID=A0A165CN87_9APHY|nr:uncharacterized protein LAESUDRAFT_762303 [Laetiporus sulphureus 93-53]KZT03119.1 hypothetical protein LAESUDRAFT_762303 [Laetiporus sulphureus 93-53]
MARPIVATPYYIHARYYSPTPVAQVTPGPLASALRTQMPTCPLDQVTTASFTVVGHMPVSSLPVPGSQSPFHAHLPTSVRMPVLAPPDPWSQSQYRMHPQDSELPKASKCKATPRIDLDTHYKHQETNKEHGRLLTLASLGASSTDRQRAAARVVDTTHIIKRGIIRKPRDHTPLLECYKLRKGRLTTGSRKPRPPPEIITSNAVSPIIVAPQPVPTLHIKTLKKQVSTTRFRLQPILGAFWERIDQDKRKKVQLLASELDKVCADLYTGTREYTFIDKQVVNTCCLEIGRINFKEIGKQQRLDEIIREIGEVKDKQYLGFIFN